MLLAYVVSKSVRHLSDHIQYQIVEGIIQMLT